MALPEITGDRPCLRRSRNPLHFVNNDGGYGLAANRAVHGASWIYSGRWCILRGREKNTPPGGQKIP
jgi:hypothetical protein